MTSSRKLGTTIALVLAFHAATYALMWRPAERPLSQVQAEQVLVLVEQSARPGQQVSALRVRPVFGITGMSGDAIRMDRLAHFERCALVRPVRAGQILRRIDLKRGCETLIPATREADPLLPRLKRAHRHALQRPHLPPRPYVKLEPRAEREIKPHAPRNRMKKSACVFFWGR